MDEAIEILKKIGVKEINKTTKISVNKIEDILEKRFSNIQRVRVVGFLKILEREYKVDLSEWLKEYDASFVVEVDTSNESNPSIVEHPVSNLYLDTQKQKDDLIAERKKQVISKKRFYILIAAVIVVLGGYFIFKSFSHHSDVEVVNQPTQNTDIKEEDADESSVISAIDNQNNVIEKDNPTNIPSTPSSKSKDAQKKENIPQPKQTSPEVSIAQNQPTQATQSASTSLPNVAQEDNSNIQEGEILVIPKRSLWVEVIDLNTNDKKQTIIQDQYPIKTGSDKLLISFGHGELTIQNNDERVEYDKSYPLRFLYTPQDGLKQIRYSKYLELSGQDQ